MISSLSLALALLLLWAVGTGLIILLVTLMGTFILQRYYSPFSEQEGRAWVAGGSVFWLLLLLLSAPWERGT